MENLLKRLGEVPASVNAIAKCREFLENYGENFVKMSQSATIQALPGEGVLLTSYDEEREVNIEFSDNDLINVRLHFSGKGHVEFEVKSVDKIHTQIESLLKDLLR